MILYLTRHEADQLNKYNNLIYQFNYETSTGRFYVPNDMLVSELQKIWPKMSLQLI